MSSLGEKMRKEVRISDYVVDVPKIIMNPKLFTSYERLQLLGSVSIVTLNTHVFFPFIDSKKKTIRKNRERTVNVLKWHRYRRKRHLLAKFSAKK